MDKNILIVEDDLLLQETLKEMLELKGFSVDATSSYNEAIDLTFENRYNCYIFDVNIVQGNGFELLKELREADDTTPTIFLTTISDAQSVVKGFEIGANDYVKKPFEFEELFARVNRFLKPKNRIKIAENIYYNPMLNAVCNNNSVVYLKAKEADILEYFLKNPNRIISKDEIIGYIWSNDYITDSTFRGYILKLKNVIGKDYIKNIRGKGYIFEKL